MIIQVSYIHRKLNNTNTDSGSKINWIWIPPTVAPDMKALLNTESSFR